MSSLVPEPPWHYSGDMLTVEFRVDPASVAELLPEPLHLAEEDPGAVAVVWADWQSCSDGFGELLDPERAQYKECFVVVRCRYRGQHYSRCVYIWVDKDFAMVRGHVQGYPKKLGDIWMTRPVTVGRAGPRLEPGSRFGATCSATGRRLVEAQFTITGPSNDAGFVNALPMAHYGYRKNWPCAASRLVQAAFEASGAGMTCCPSMTVCCDWSASKRTAHWSSMMSRFACWNALALSSESGRLRCITPANWLR